MMFNGYNKVRLGMAVLLCLCGTVMVSKGKVACLDFRRNGIAARTNHKSMGNGRCRRKHSSKIYQRYFSDFHNK